MQASALWAAVWPQVATCTQRLHMRELGAVPGKHNPSSAIARRCQHNLGSAHCRTSQGLQHHTKPLCRRLALTAQSGGEALTAQSCHHVEMLCLSTSCARLHVLCRQGGGSLVLR
jgi:hypothetical protein